MSFSNPSYPLLSPPITRKCLPISPTNPHLRQSFSYFEVFTQCCQCKRCLSFPRSPEMLQELHNICLGGQADYFIIKMLQVNNVETNNKNLRASADKYCFHTRHKEERYQNRKCRNKNKNHSSSSAIAHLF